MANVFIIPTQKEDLLNSNNEFCVVHTHQISGLSSNYRDLTSSFGEAEIGDYIQDFLNVYYYVTEHLCDMNWKYVNFYSEILRKVWSQLLTKIDLYFKKKMYECLAVLNETKIILYMTNEFISELDKKFSNANMGKKNAKKGIGESDLYYNKFCIIKENVLRFMLSMSSKNLPLLYNPPLPEAQFTDLLADCCYKSLKDSNFIKQNDIREMVFQIFGNLIKHYNHSNTFVIKFVHAIKNTDVTCQNALVTGLLQIKKNFDLNSIIEVLAKEILILAEKETSNESIDLKHVMNFLSEVGAQMPSALVPILGDIQSLDNFDMMPTIRMCYIYIIGETLKEVYNIEGLNAEDKEFRDGLLEDLYDMLHDVSALVRSKVLQIFTKLLKEKALPISWLVKIMSRAVGRLRDKGILVRKNAIVLLKEFIMNRPAEVPMERDTLTKNLDEATETLRNLQSQKISGHVEDIKAKSKARLLPFLQDVFATDASLKIYEEMTFADETLTDIGDKILQSFNNEKYDDLLKYTIFMEKSNKEILQARQGMALEDIPEYFFYAITKLVCQIMVENGTIKDTGASEEVRKQIEDQENVIELLKMSLQYSEIISSALPIIEEMLYSKAANDSNEAIVFFTSTLELGIDSAYDSLLKVLYLLVTQKENKDQVYKMMTEIFLSDKTSNERLDAASSLNKLSFLICKMKKCHSDPMCLLFKHWIKEDLVTPAFIQLCWERVTKKHENTTQNYIYASLVILKLIAVNKPNVVSTNLSVVTSALLGEASKSDIQYAIHTLRMLKNMFSSDVPISKTTMKLVCRLPNDDVLFEKISDLVIHHFEDEKTGSFRQLVNVALAVIYMGADQPQLIIKKLVLRMLKIDASTDLSQNVKMSCWRISRIVHTIGQAAANYVALLDVFVYHELGRRKEVMENSKRKAANDTFQTPSVNSTKSKIMHSASRSAMNNSSKYDDDNDDEHKAIGNAEDLEANFILEMLDKEILVEPAAFSYALSYVKDIVDNRNKYDDADLQIDATNALTSFMTVSAKVCSENMQLLMTIFKHSKYPDVKINIIVAFADLLARFATVVEPWESFLFEKLKDTDKAVRKTALKFICQLILTNIIRPKCYISDVALFLVDKDESLKNIADHFFKEMSSNDSNLYNALPDIISKLTDPASNIVEARFQMIMKNILRYISKERHMDGLVQKLCLRLQIAVDEKQFRNLAYCLSILNCSVKSVQVLIDNLDNIKTTLNTPEVYKIFKDIASQGNKALSKPDMKAACAELDNKIEALFEVNEDREKIDRMEVTKKSTKKPINKRSQKQRCKSTSFVAPSSDSIAGRRPIRSQGSRRRVVLDDTSSSSDEEERRRVSKRRS